jgi:GGDEF domain-containing protein
MKNLEFLSRHYGMMMRIYFKRSVTHALRPLLQPTELLFQLPGSELLLVLEGSQAADRLQHMLDYLNSQRFHWQNTALMSSSAPHGETLTEPGKHCTLC